MIYKYLTEIKYRIFFSFIAWNFIMINCYCFKETLLYLFMQFSSKSNDSNLLVFLTTDIAEVFITYIDLSFHIANQVTIIFLYCHFFLFLSTGLYFFEYNYFRTILLVTITCWGFFIFILNSYLFPISWDFFFKFQEYLAFQNLAFYFEAKLSEYLAFYKLLYYICNTLWQAIILFCVILDLLKTNLVLVKKFRKLFYLIFFIFSTILTPPDIIYQLTTSICIIIFYELFTIYLLLRIEIIDLNLGR